MVVCGCNSKPRAQPVNAAVKSRASPGGACGSYGRDFHRAAAGDHQFQNLVIGYIFPFLAVAGPAGVPVELRRKNQLNAFLASCVYLLGMLTSVVFGVYPMVLPARYPTFALTVENAKLQTTG